VIALLSIHKSTVLIIFRFDAFGGNLDCFFPVIYGTSLTNIISNLNELIMNNSHNMHQSRRKFIKTSSAIAGGMAFAPYISCSTKNGVTELMKRPFGKIGFDVTTFGLGGQASIQWTPPDVDPVNIILKAFEKKVNYFDTSNLYGPSQLNFGQAFKELSLIPGKADYNEKLRKSVFLTSKTHLRVAKGNNELEGVRNRTNGVQGSYTVDDLKRTLSQIYGDGNGNYPAGAYLDMVLIHNLNTTEEVDALYTAYENPNPDDEQIGALAALLDYRDGTNTTGLNPREEKLINHIGFSGHYSAAVMMDMIRRDTKNILDGMLVAINANDKLNFNMQNNVIPVAQAKNMGIIGMKVFADGAMYTKEANWSNEYKHVVRTVGDQKLPSRPLIEYALSTPGICTQIIGIGQVDEDSQNCQMTQNISAAQITPEGLSTTERSEVEKMALAAKEGKTNYFQIPKGGLTAVTNPRVIKTQDGGVDLKWDTAYAGNELISKYVVMKNGEQIGDVKHQPQITNTPFSFEDIDDKQGEYTIVTVDEAGQQVVSEKIMA
jgi:aryl-alcohol dehydrogenase-like predicted oxidoreductase